MCYWSFWKILTFPWLNSRGKSNPIQYLHTTFYQQLLWYEEVPFPVHCDTFFRLKGIVKRFIPCFHLLVRFHRIGILFPFKTNNSERFLYRIGFKTPPFWKWYKSYGIGFKTAWNLIETLNSVYFLLKAVV